MRISDILHIGRGPINSVVHKAYRCTVGTVTLKIESVYG
jgi:hypothetical protein